MSKILFLTLKTFSFTGGIEKACRTLAYALRKIEGVRLQLWSMYDRQHDLNSQYLSDREFIGFGNRKFQFAKAVFFKGFNFDTVILSHVNLLLFGKIIHVFSPKTKIILWAHGIEVWRDLPKWKISFLKKHATVWAVSRFTQAQLQQIHGIPENRIRVLNNCLDPFFDTEKTLEKPDYLLERHNLNQNQQILLTLTRLSHTEHRKNYDAIISCVAELKNTYPDLVYLIGGKADLQEKERLEKLITEHNVKEHIKLLGFIEEEELVDHYLLADSFVLPSQKEGFGIVFIEAAANGCNVLAGNSDGSTDALRNGELGILVNPNSREEIRKGLVELLKSPINKEKQRDSTLQYFSFQEFQKQVEGLIGPSTPLRVTQNTKLYKKT